MSESTQGCRSTINTINSKVKNTAKKWFHAIKAAFVYKKNGLREPAELPCLPPLKRADTDMITTRDLAAWAAQNQHTACTTLTGTMCNMSPRGPLLPTLKRAYTDMITTRDLAAWAARNQHTACTACTTPTGTTCKLSPRGPLLPALKKAYTGLDTKRDLATFATRNQHTACSTALTGGTPCSIEEESRRQKESHEWASFLYRRRGFSDDIMLV